MRKAMSRILLSGILAAAVLGATACSSKKEEATAAGTTAGGSQETVASADGIGFPKDETITLVVPGKAGGGSDLWHPVLQRRAESSVWLKDNRNQL